MVNHLLRNANGLRLAVLVNEFGELAIDEDLIEAQDDDIISIAGGCVCCSFGSDLTGALMELARLDPQPDHVLIESSGVAIPSAIAGSVSLLEGFRTDGIVIVADVETVQSSASHKYMGDTVLRQITDANIIVLNKTDLVGEAHLSETKQWLGKRNGGARVIETTHSIVPPAAILDCFLVQKTSAALHFEASNLEMMTINFEEPVDAEELAEKLADDNLGLIRAKGFVTSLTGEKALIQVVGRRWNTSQAPDNKLSGIVCLGFKGVISKQDIKNIGSVV